ncbi:unnamed protein product, partial [Cylicostephanus goldi]
MRVPLDTEKMHGPTFNLLSDANLEERESLIWKVATCSPSQLSALVIGTSVYEVFMDLPDCEILHTSMAYVKRKQLRISSAAALRWMCKEMKKFKVLLMFPFRQEEEKCLLINREVMRKLYEFTNARALYDSVPRFRSEKQLPAVVNALGPMEQLTANYPHLAQMKEEMVCNIMDFILNYCLDWICEVSSLKCDS